MRVPTIARRVSFSKYGPRDHGPDDLDSILLDKRRTVVSSLAVRSHRTNFQPYSHPVAAKTSQLEELLGRDRRDRQVVTARSKAATTWLREAVTLVRSCVHRVGGQGTKRAYTTHHENAILR